MLCSSIAVLGLLLAGCAPQGGLLDDEAVLGMALPPCEVADDTEFSATSRGAQAKAIHLGDDGDAVVLSGSVGGEGDYDIFGFGPSRAGDRWVLEPGGPSGASIIAALFDENMHLLARSAYGSNRAVTHVMRRDCSAVFVGVAAAPKHAGGPYRYRVSRAAGFEIPRPQPQLVWLNFGGAANLTIARHADMTFGPFDAAALGERYAGAADEIRRAIVDTMLRVYADYDVTIVTSDEMPEPVEPHTTVNFGCDDYALLGLAENVDAYNADPEQQAIVFVERFADYGPMRLDPQQMGRMIGNTASHELGHLLGLHHTYAANDIMDTDAGSAWEMAGARVFGVAALDSDVFPIGELDVPQVLADTVGLRTD